METRFRVVREEEREQVGSAPVLLHVQASLGMHGTKRGNEVAYDLVEVYLSRLDSQYTALADNYRKLLRTYHLLYRLMQALLPVTSGLLVAGLIGAFYAGHALEIVLLVGGLVLILLLLAGWFNRRYIRERNGLLDQFSVIFELYLEVFQIQEGVDEQKRGERLHELLRDRPLFKEISRR